MKTVIACVVLVLVSAMVLSAATASVSLSVTNGQAISYSSQIPASGTLDKIEVVQTAGYTSTVTVATFSGSTAIETLASLTTLVGNKVVRPRVVPTDNTGSALAANGATNASQATALTIPYARPMVGGNLLLAVTPSGGSATGIGTNAVSVTLYFDKSPALIP